MVGRDLTDFKQIVQAFHTLIVLSSSHNLLLFNFCR